MKVGIGTHNPVKIGALTELLQDYPMFEGFEVFPQDVSSGVSEQPLTLDETVCGAVNRAKSAYVGNDYGFGLESGLMLVPQTQSGHMDMCVCAVYDGTSVHLGISSAWEAPDLVNKYMLEDGLDMNEAAFKASLTESLKVGSEEGLIGIVTNGRLNRKAYTKEAIRSALIHVEAQ